MIPLLDLQPQHRALKGEIAAAIARVIESGQFVLGPAVAEFEERFAAYCGVRYGVAVNSGTSALQLALLALGVGPGDEVVTVPFTFVASVEAILYTGATPVFVDIDPATFTLEPRALEKAITSRTRAILPVHLYGHPADMDAIGEIARKHGVSIVEDAAQAHGARYKGRPVGSLGDLACFSFYPSKNLGAFGEGGIVVTDSEHHARMIRLLRNWGQDGKYNHVLHGFNYRMDEIQGAVLGVKLPHLEAWNDARRTKAARYERLLRTHDIQTPATADWATHVFHVYSVRVPGRDGVQRTLAARGIQTGVHYPVPVHLQAPFANLGYLPGSFRHAERAAGEVLSLPLYPDLPDAHVEAVASALADALVPA